LARGIKTRIKLRIEDPVTGPEVILALSQTCLRRLELWVVGKGILYHSVQLGGIKKAPPVCGDTATLFKSLGLTVSGYCRDRVCTMGVAFNLGRTGTYKVRPHGTTQGKKGKK